MRQSGETLIYSSTQWKKERRRVRMRRRRAMAIRGLIIGTASVVLLIWLY